MDDKDPSHPAPFNQLRLARRVRSPRYLEFSKGTSRFLFLLRQRGNESKILFHSDSPFHHQCCASQSAHDGGKRTFIST